MIPCFSKDFIYEVIRTLHFSKSGTGFGLESLWAAILNYNDMYIIDETSVTHTRPIGGFRNSELSEMAVLDAEYIQIGMGLPWIQKTLSGVTVSGDLITLGHHNLDLYFAGYDYVKNQNYDKFETLTFLQNEEKDYIYNFDLGPYFDFLLAHWDVGEKSIAWKKPSLVSSVSKFSRSHDPFLEAQGANNGKMNGHCGFHTDYELNPWWQVDLLQTYDVTHVLVYNRMDQQFRCRKIALLISQDNLNWELVSCKIDDELFGGIDGNPYIFSFERPRKAQFVRIQLVGNGFLHLDQIEIFDIREDVQPIIDAKGRNREHIGYLSAAFSS